MDGKTDLFVTPVKQKRIHPRRKTPPNIVYFAQIAFRGYGEIRDVSNGGMHLKTQNRIEIGAIEISFKLPPSKKMIMIASEAVWVLENKENGYKAGIKFHLVNLPNQHLLQNFFDLCG